MPTDNVMQLTRYVPAVPARTVRVTVLWCRQEFMKFDDEFRQARAATSRKMDTCFWCRHAFKDGEMMALAQIKGKRNEMLCQECAAQLKGPADAD